MIMVMVSAFLALVVGCNVWYWRHRRGMTPAEREQDDRDMETGNYTW